MKGLEEWVREVRALKRWGNLSKLRAEQLESIGFDWRVKDQTLDDTNGLLNETEFLKVSGLTNLINYRRQGIVKPIGRGFSASKLSYFYHPTQVKELKKKLGITLESTKGLLTEEAFIKKTGLSRIARYRKQKLITPIGHAITHSGLSCFYHPKQINELRKKLGITLTNTTGLINEKKFIKLSGLSRIGNYREQKLIKPIGRAFSGGTLSYFYHPKQIGELKKKLGITLSSTKGLMNEKKFIKVSGFSNIARYRKQNLIIPIGYAIAGGGLSKFYHPKQIKELKNKLGITLSSTNGLLNETQFIKISGLSRIAKYRKKGIIKPIGKGMALGNLSYFYHPKQIKSLKKKLGITIDNTKGLISENAIAKICGLTKIANYRMKGLIKPLGYAIASSGLCTFYHPKQVKELKEKLKNN